MCVCEWERGETRGGNNNMNFSLLSSMDFSLHQISVGPDETKAIRETQVGHLRAITAKRAHCLWRKANAAYLTRKVKSPILVLVLFLLPVIKQY